MTLHDIPFAKSETDARPVYHQMARAIQDYIENGILSVGERIPSEREFASQYDLSLATVRKALDHLVQQGLLKRIQGKGTFVASTDIRRHKLRYYPFVKDFHEDAFITTVEFLDLCTLDGEERINRHLLIKPDDTLYRVKRILLCRKTPLVYSVSYLPTSMFHGLSKYEPHRFEKYLYVFLEDEFGVSTIANEELYGSALADEETAGYLQVEPQHPLLQIEMMAYTHKHKPYEYRMSYCLTDEMKVRRMI